MGCVLCSPATVALQVAGTFEMCCSMITTGECLSVIKYKSARKAVKLVSYDENV